MNSNGNRERLAWSVLFAGFFVCVLLTVSAPLMVNAAVQEAKRPLTVLLQANAGTVVVQDRAGSRALFPGNPVDSLGDNQSILTNATDAALMLVYNPDGSRLMAWIQVYGGTDVTLEDASAPRFDISSAPTNLNLTLSAGRVRVKILPFEAGSGRPLVVKIETPQGVIDIQDPGQYTVEGGDAATQVSVQEGMAEVVGQTETLQVFMDQRAMLNGESAPVGPLNSERDLIKNGDFNEELSNWALLAWEVERAGQPEGSARVDGSSGDAAFYVRRDGIGHAEVSLRQTLNQDVTDFQSLRLMLSMRVNEQSLGVCGIQGSECPLTLRIEYDDVNGISRTWQQGFFSTGEIAPNTTPDICVTCATVQRAHQRIPMGQLVFYEADLLVELARQGMLPPSRIKSVSLVVAGHTFEVEVVDVALVGKE